MSHTLRFGLQTRSDDPAGVIAESLRAEQLGFDVVLVADHVGSDHSPMMSLAAAALATSDIRLGTLVINASLHHPVMLTREVVSLDHLSGGRVELGLGAGHTPAEFAACGIPMLPAAARKTRLAEFVEIIRALVDGDTFDGRTEHFDLQRARNAAPAHQSRLPILVGGSGSSLLAHAGEHADIVGLTGLGRTLADGQHHEVRFAPEVVDAEVAIITGAAAARRDGIDPELNVLVQVVDITSDRTASAQKLADEIPSLTVHDALSTPFLALGTHDQIAEHIEAVHRRWGLSYFVVRDAEAFAPVIARLR